jgi:holo-[acyl-carrier protein] synthase
VTAASSVGGSLSVGVDIVEIERIRQIFQRHGERFLRRVYTEAEIAYCQGRVPELAARFAAKEAVSKALGTGIVGRGGIFWREVEVLPDARGKPLVHLHSQAQDRAASLGLKEFAISLSHSQEYAVAFVVATRG